MNFNGERRQTGTAIIEYAIILAFICVCGYAMLGSGSNKFTNGIGDIVQEAAEMLGVATNRINIEKEKEYLKTAFANNTLNKGMWNMNLSTKALYFNTDSYNNEKNGLGLDEPIQLDPNGTYKITFDRDAVSLDKYSDCKGFAFVLMAEDKDGNKTFVPGTDTNYDKFTSSMMAAGTAGYTFDIPNYSIADGSKVYLVVNTQKNVWGELNDTQRANYTEAMKKGLNIEHVVQ